MAASPGVPTSSASSPFVTSSGTPSITHPQMEVCRVCAKEGSDFVHIFSEAGKSADLPNKVKEHLPVLITEQDELSKAVCPECIQGLDSVRAFFQKCFNGNQELIIALRKSRPSPLDLNTHINQYVRSFNAPIVPQIKIEPYLDVDLLAGGGDEKFDKNNGYYDDEWIVNEDDEEEVDSDDESESDEDSEDEDFGDIFKIPKNPKRVKNNRNKHQIKNEDNGIKSNRGRKRFVPLALKTCSLCGKEFSDHAGNLAHWKELHPDHEVIYKCQELDRISNQQCNFSSKESEDIFKHRNKHKIRDAFANSEVKQEAQIDCKICGKYFTTSFLIYRHMSTHEDRKDFKCGVCGMERKSADDLKSHLKSHEPEDAKYSHCCELCGKRFTQRANLDAHLRVHSGIKPYVCDFCNKSFSQKGNMEEHRRVHTGERPFVCEQCGSSFVRRSEMALHNRIVHTGERPYQCAYCPKNFQRRDLMRKHERIHTDTRPYACQFCHKAFTQRDKMVVHTRLHTGERPYVCEVCGKGFCESGNLKKHMRVHGKEPPQIMHQNNKGKPAPNQHNFETKPTPNQLLLQQQQFQQAMANEGEGSNSNASSLVTNNRPESVNSPPPQQQQQQPQPPTTSQNFPPSLQLKLSNAEHPTTAHHQYGPFAAVAAALHNQMGQPSAAVPSSASNVTAAAAAPSASMNNYVRTNSNDVDTQSEAGSERSVNVASPFVNSNMSSHHHPQPLTPYHMHHSIIQHLSEMRDLYGSTAGSAAGHQQTLNHSSNH